MDNTKLFESLRQAIIDGEQEDATKWANEILKEKINPLTAIEEGIRKGLDKVGDAFRKGEIFLPELVMAGEAAMISTGILEKGLETGSDRKASRGKVLIGTVAGDVHDIGKTLVATLFKADGFSVIDLGVNIPASKFVEAVKESKPDILGLSSLLTTTVPEQKTVIEALKNAGIRSSVKIMVGGGSVTQEWANEIGADAYGQDAADAVEQGRKLLGL
jgi:trimethylamine corrinoid protein